MLTYCDISLNGYAAIILRVFETIAISSGIAVIISKNPISALIWLIGLFATISLYLIFVGLTYIAFSYLIVYIGAVSILFLFILMLINIRSSELQSNNSNSIPLALFVTTLLNDILFPLLPYYIVILNSYKEIINENLYYLEQNKYKDTKFNMNLKEKSYIFSNLYNIFFKYYESENMSTFTNIMFVSSNNWDGNMTETSHISTIGNILYSSHNIFLFMSSFILILAMVGAIIITIEPIVNETNMSGYKNNKSKNLKSINIDIKSGASLAMRKLDYRNNNSFTELNSKSQFKAFSTTSSVYRRSPHELQVPPLNYGVNDNPLGVNAQTWNNDVADDPDLTPEQRDMVIARNERRELNIRGREEEPLNQVSPSPASVSTDAPSGASVVTENVETTAHSLNILCYNSKVHFKQSCETASTSNTDGNTYSTPRDNSSEDQEQLRESIVNTEQERQPSDSNKPFAKRSCSDDIEEPSAKRPRLDDEDKGGSSGSNGDPSDSGPATKDENTDKALDNNNNTENVQSAEENVQSAAENAQSASENVQSAAENVQSTAENVQSAASYLSAADIAEWVKNIWG
uniref:NADH dehydrogenase subunit 6 n=1 Tax=Hirsutella thompsonii TaxID=42368 RepID=A0A3G2ZPJ7_HIRTH|nr:NADH dehydrogenase subunit 6 [Hirsutella thompsonii]